MNLQDLRNDIDSIDKEILSLFIKRMSLCKNVAQFKIENNLPVYQGNREQDIIDNIRENTPSHLADGAAALFYNIMDISKCVQQEELLMNTPFISTKKLDLSGNVKVGCQGMDGSNSNTAADLLFNSPNIVYYHEFEDVFKAVDNGDVKFGVLPVQNSTTGSIIQIYDLMKKYDFYVARMVRVEIDHCLAVKKNTNFNNVKNVYSHPQALSQCSAFISENNLRAIPYENTATAAKFISQSNEPLAAICSERCANMYDFNIIAKNIADSSPNYTRFICISKDFYLSDDADVISILITIPNIQGSLSRLLTKFFVNGLNLEKLESRPLAGGSFNVMFYIDFQGNVNNPKVSALLTELQNEYPSFKFIGNFKEQV